MKLAYCAKACVEMFGVKAANMMCLCIFNPFIAKGEFD